MINKTNRTANTNSASRDGANAARTELVFILDRSGSMSGLETDTIGGFNAMLAKQQAQEGDCRITTVLFDDNYEILHDRLDLAAVLPVTEREYYVRGSTALLDAVGKTIEKIVNAQRTSKPDYRADKVLFVITTDGMENASRTYTHDDVKRKIEYQKERYGWEFIFLGANIDAGATAERIGIRRDRSQSFHNDSRGVELNYRVVGEAIASHRSSPRDAKLSADWNAEIAADFRARGGE